jgi:hypothetical protein
LACRAAARASAMAALSSSVGRTLLVRAGGPVLDGEHAPSRGRLGAGHNGWRGEREGLGRRGRRSRRDMSMSAGIGGAALLKGYGKVCFGLTPVVTAPAAGGGGGPPP